MKYTVQYGLERFLLQRATRRQDTIEDGEKDMEVDKVTEKVQPTSAPTSPVKKIKDCSDTESIDLDGQYVRTLLEDSESETGPKERRRHTLSGDQMKEAIMKAMLAKKRDGTDKEGIEGLVFEVIKDTMEVIANDQGNDFSEDWNMQLLEDNDMDKVVAKTNELTTRSEGDMDTRDPTKVNPLLGPSEQSSGGSMYIPPSLEQGPPDDDDLAEDDATLKQ